MAPKMHLLSAIFIVITLMVFSAGAQEIDVESMDNLLCTKDESTRESVLKCISLMPSVHLEVIKECDTRMANVAEDEYEKMLDIYCSEDEEGFEGVEECVSEAYETRGIDEEEHARPVIECMKGLVSKK